MTSLKLQLEKLARQAPDLNHHIKAVYQSLPSQRQKQANDVEDIFMDGNIAGVSSQLADVMNRRFREHQLEPYMGTVNFENNEIEITVSAYFRGKEYRSPELEGIAEKIVDDIERRGFRRIEAEGYNSEISGNALFIFTQRT